MFSMKVKYRPLLELKEEVYGWYVAKAKALGMEVSELMSKALEFARQKEAELLEFVKK